MPDWPHFLYQGRETNKDKAIRRLSDVFWPHWRSLQSAKKEILTVYQARNIISLCFSFASEVGDNNYFMLGNVDFILSLNEKKIITFYRKYLFWKIFKEILTYSFSLWENLPSLFLPLMWERKEKRVFYLSVVLFDALLFFCLTGSYSNSSH